ncbi:MAG: hypothetical protein KGL35_16125 [Bradyrhizobium sp.]|nr:hypothetical protein [Bradyrhizobium sp.]
MNLCSRPECQGPAGCQCNTLVPLLPPLHVEYMPAYLPRPQAGEVTVAKLDARGKLVIKTVAVRR